MADTEVRAWAARLAQAVVEAVGGQRPVSQLVRWTAPDVYRDLERRGSSSRLGAPAAARRCARRCAASTSADPTATSAEVSVHVRHAERSRALAMRLERHGDRWQCTVLEFG